MFSLFGRLQVSLMRVLQQVEGDLGLVALRSAQATHVVLQVGEVALLGCVQLAALKTQAGSGQHGDAGRDGRVITEVNFRNDNRLRRFLIVLVNGVGNAIGPRIDFLLLQVDVLTIVLIVGRAGCGVGDVCHGMASGSAALGLVCSGGGGGFGSMNFRVLIENQLPTIEMRAGFFTN